MFFSDFAFFLAVVQANIMISVNCSQISLYCLVQRYHLVDMRWRLSFCGILDLVPDSCYGLR